MTVEVDAKGRPIDQVCKHCGRLFTAKKLRKHIDTCKGPVGLKVCDLSGAARARRVRLLFSPKKKKKKGRSVFTVNGGAYGLGKSRKH
ncbi:C2HC-type zinc finger protein [Pseudomonas asiatica]|uniref:C2HC-type zinc finger protein n=1 Tax=Pseudomonas asiatica TaxID=2219225 RepID=UPI0018AA37EC|nr:C2HC-type zinc finger protein [Pseudomonas asiatica]MBF8802258.1 C2HC-type zinc finger protein [Pseudomonas asiatica]